jgi:hypothetical protein
MNKNTFKEFKQNNSLGEARSGGGGGRDGSSNLKIETYLNLGIGKKWREFLIY